MIGHRGAILKSCTPRSTRGCRRCLEPNSLYFFRRRRHGGNGGGDSESGWEKVLNCMCGAFSDKWLDVSRRCGKEADSLQVEWGRPILPEALDAKLAEGDTIP